MNTIKNFIVIFCVSLLSIAAFAQTAPIKPLIFVAVEEGDVNQLKALLNAGVNVNEVYEGVSLLNKAWGSLLHSNNEIINILLDSPKINVNAIALAEPGYDNDMATTPLIVLLR